MDKGSITVRANRAQETYFFTVTFDSGSYTEFSITEQQYENYVDNGVPVYTFK